VSLARGGTPLTTLVAAGCLLAGCATLRPRGVPLLVPVGARELPEMTDDAEPGSLRRAVERTIPAYSSSAEAAAAQRLLDILASASSPVARRTAIADAFRVVRARDPLLLTAYYEPELAGRLQQDPAFRFPIYARPPDLIDVDPPALDAACTCRRTSGRIDGGRLRPYPTRADIDAGALAGRGLELAWAADPLALFSLHVQGSGRLRLSDGQVLELRYAGTNGRSFRGPAQALRERGLLGPGGASMPDIRRALATLPEHEQTAVLATNERFTFFRVAPGEPVGSLGVALTPGRSIAADPRLVPPGALGYLATPSVRRFVVSQDAGAAVTGAHADLFLGAGAEAEEQAGRMNERGILYLLLPR